MKVIPAMDLIQGQCVRLEQGNFNRKTQYAVDPFKVAAAWKRQGATFCHAVDLDGAQEGKSRQCDLVQRVKKDSGLQVQLGGGFRSLDDIEMALSAGIDRVVLGSLAVTAVDTVTAIIKQFGVERFVLALDVRVRQNPVVAIHGWQKVTDCVLWDVLEAYRDFDNLSILCTDIERDGLLQGPNLSLYEALMVRFPRFRYQASGGVSCLDDLMQCATIGMDAAIVGKALYEKRFSYEDAIKEVQRC